MDYLDTIFAFISFLLAFLAAAILLWVNKEQRHSNHMLALVLFIFSFQCLNNALIYSTWMLYVPWMFRIVTPFSLLIAPAAFIYTRSILLGEVQFRKNDGWLLLPALLYAINLIPLYTMQNAAKHAYLTRLFTDTSLQSQHGDGILPAYIFSFVRLGWSAVFIGLNYRQIKLFTRFAGKQATADNTALLRWLIIFNGLLMAILAVMLVFAITAPINKTNPSIADFVLGLSVIIICISLFIRPQLLYGLYQPLQVVPPNIFIELPLQVNGTLLPEEESKSQNGSSSLDSALLINQYDDNRYKKIVEKLFLEQKPYLQAGYTLEQLVADTCLHRYTLSAFINKKYGMGFREFLNRHRVDYFKQNLERPDWKQLTLEAIAEQCGFSSRSSFIKNFKDFTGQTPSEYVKKTHP